MTEEVDVSSVQISGNGGVSHWESLNHEAFNVITSFVLDLKVHSDPFSALSAHNRPGERILAPLLLKERDALVAASSACGSQYADSLIIATPQLLTGEGDMNPAAKFVFLLNQCHVARRKIENTFVPVGVVTEIQVSESGKLITAVDSVATQDTLLRNVDLEFLKSIQQQLFSIEHAKTAYLAKYGPPRQSAMYLHYLRQHQYKETLNIPRPDVSVSSGLLSGRELTAKCSLVSMDSFCHGGFPFLCDVVLQEAVDRVTDRVDVVEALLARVPDLQRYQASALNDRFSSAFSQVEELHALASFRARRKSAVGATAEQDRVISAALHTLPSSEAVKLIADARNEICETEQELLALVAKYPAVVDELPFLIPAYSKERLATILEKCQSSEGWFWDFRNQESRINVRIEKEEAQREIVALDLLVKGGVPDPVEDQLVPYPERVPRESDPYQRDVLFPAPLSKHTNLSQLREKLLALEEEDSPKRIQGDVQMTPFTEKNVFPCDTQSQILGDGGELDDTTTDTIIPHDGHLVPPGSGSSNTPDGAVTTAKDALPLDVLVTSQQRRDEVEQQQLRLQLEYRQHEGRLFENEDKQDVRDPSIHQHPDYFDKATKKSPPYLNEKDTEFLRRFGQTLFARIKGANEFANLPDSYNFVRSVNQAEKQQREIQSANVKQKFEGSVARQLAKVRALESLGVACALVPSATYCLGQRDPLRHSTLLPIAGSIDRSSRLDGRTNFWLASRAPDFMMSVGGGIHSAKYLDGPAHFMYNTRRRDVFLGNYQVSVKPVTVRQLLSIADTVLHVNNKRSSTTSTTNSVSAAMNSIPHMLIDTHTTVYYEPTMMAGRLESFVEHIRKRRVDVRQFPGKVSSNEIEQGENVARQMGLLFDDDTVEVPYFVAAAIAAAVGGVVCPVDVWEAAARGIDNDPTTGFPREFILPKMDIEGELGVERLYWHFNVKGERMSRDVPGYSWRICDEGAAQMRSFKGPFGHALLGRQGFEWNSSIPLNAASDSDMCREIEKEDNSAMAGSAGDSGSGVSARQLLQQQLQAANSFVSDASTKFSTREDVVEIGSKEARFGVAVKSLDNALLLSQSQSESVTEMDEGRLWLPRCLNHKHLREEAFAGKLSPNEGGSPKSPASLNELLSGDDDTAINQLREVEGCPFPSAGASTHVLRTCFDHNTQVLFEGEVISTAGDNEDEPHNIASAAQGEPVPLSLTQHAAASRPNTAPSSGFGKASSPHRIGGANTTSIAPLLKQTLDTESLLASRPGTAKNLNSNGALTMTETSPLKRRRQRDAERRARNAMDYDNYNAFSGPAFHTFSLPNHGVPVAAFRIAVPICDKAVIQVRKGDELLRAQSGANITWDTLIDSLAAGIPRERGGRVGNSTISIFDNLVPDSVIMDSSYGTSTWVMGAAGLDLTFGAAFPNRLTAASLYGAWKGLRIPTIVRATTSLKITTSTFRDSRPNEAPRDPGCTSIGLPLVGLEFERFVAALTNTATPKTADVVEVSNLRIIFTDKIVVPPAKSHLPSTVMNAKITMFVSSDQLSGDKMIAKVTIEKLA